MSKAKHWYSKKDRKQENPEENNSRIEVKIVENARVGTSQVDSHAASSRRQEEYWDVGFVELVHESLPLLDVRRTINSKMRKTQ